MREGAGDVAAGPAPERRVRESMRRQGLRARRGRRPRRAYSSYAGEVDESVFSQVKVDSSLCRFPTLRSGHARTPSFRYQRA